MTWAASSGGNLQGYNIYRSIDGINFSKINGSLAGTPNYTDTNPGDGVRFYKVTAVGDAESNSSNATKNARGTRLSGTYNSGYATTSGLYVIEGTVTINGGNFTVASGTGVYLLDGATIDMEQDRTIVVNGTLQVRAAATPAGHATLTSHRIGGGTPTANNGFLTNFSSAANFNSLDYSGTLFENADIKYIKTGVNRFYLNMCALKFDNCKISTNNHTSSCCFQVRGGAIFTHCSLTGINPIIDGDLHATTFKIEYSVLDEGVLNYCIDFAAATNPIVSGQISQNDFHNTGPIDLASITGSDIPLDNNYWRNGHPTYIRQGTTPVTLGCTFSPELSAAPANVGPVGW